MIINDGAPVYEHFYSDFVDILQDQKPNIYDTRYIYDARYILHVYDSYMTHAYHPGSDNSFTRDSFLSSVLRQIAIDGVAIVLVTNDFGKCVYIIASDD